MHCVWHSCWAFLPPAVYRAAGERDAQWAEAAGPSDISRASSHPQAQKSGGQVSPLPFSHFFHTLASTCAVKFNRRLLERKNLLKAVILGYEVKASYLKKKPLLVVSKKVVFKLQTEHFLCP